MAISLQAPTNLLPIAGIQIASTGAGIKYQNRDDLVLFELCESSNTAVVLTKNQFCAAPVTVTRENLSICKPKYLLVNSGNANAGLGKKGINDVIQTCKAIASEADCRAEEILPFSTGVIGEPLPVKKITDKVHNLVSNLNENSWLDAADAIMTTDTIAKGYSEQLDLDGSRVSITGIAKGAGMIRPDMATMLAYVATDLNIETSDLQVILQNAVDQSFHSITVDGDTSTNDACTLIASGKSGIKLKELSEQAKEKFITVLNAIFLKLAQAIIRDGEGATKMICIQVEQATNKLMARDIAFTIAHSPLVKTAAFASDPNWGRILAAAGRGSDKALDIGKLSLYINELEVIEDGELSENYNEGGGQNEMQKDEILFRLRLGLGDAEATVWTTDLSYDYVKINAEYRT